MRATLSIVVLAAISTAAALADEMRPADPPTPPVYLDGPSGLARLREANPDHYARVQRILAAANQLCRAGPGQLQEIARDLKCAGALLRTSNPPKWRITFRLDDTCYVALVTIIDDPPRLTHAH